MSIFKLRVCDIPDIPEITMEFLDDICPALKDIEHIGPELEENDEFQPSLDTSFVVSVIAAYIFNEIFQKSKAAEVWQAIDVGNLKIPFSKNQIKEIADFLVEQAVLVYNRKGWLALSEKAKEKMFELNNESKMFIY